MEDPLHRHNTAYGSTFGGILHKKGTIKWEKRFFMIEHGELKWFKNLSISPNGQLKPAGSITVKNCPCGPSKGKNKEEYAFQLATLSKVVVLRAENQQDFQRWREALKKNGAIWSDELWAPESKETLESSGDGNSPSLSQRQLDRNPGTSRGNLSAQNAHLSANANLSGQSTTYSPRVVMDDIPTPPKDIWPVVGWYGLIQRPDAEALLSVSPDGSFLVRWSKNVGCYVVSYRKGMNINHISGIKPLANGQVSAEKDSGDIAHYGSLLEYITALCEGGIIVTPLFDRINFSIYHTVEQEGEKIVMK